MRKYSILIVVGLMFLSGISIFATSAPVQEPEPDAPVYVNVWHTPRYPLGHDWTTYQGGDVITVYAEITGVTGQVEIQYGYCNRTQCPLVEPSPPPFYMTNVGGDLYSYQLAGNWQAPQNANTYESSSKNGSHVEYRITTNDGVDYGYPDNNPLNKIRVWPAWQPTAINVTHAPSAAQVFPNTTFWVNGTSNYWNSTEQPKDLDPNMDTLLPCDECDVTVTVDGTPFAGKTDIEGNFSIPVTAPLAPGMYSVNTTVSNSTPNRNVNSVCTDFQIEVIDINLTVGADPATTIPNGTVNVSGQSFFSDGSIPDGSEVNVTINGQTGFWLTTVDATGNYSVGINAPNATGSFTVNVTVHNSTYNLTAWNQTPLQVIPTPLADLVVETADIVIGGPLVELQNHSINVTVRNRGIANANNVVVNTSVNGTLHNSTVIDIPVSGNVMLPIFWHPDAGVMNISVVVDPTDQIEESSETNNTAWKVVSIRVDTDGDGLPDETDDDDDNDGYLDVWEVFAGTDPLDFLDTPLDTDGDGAPDGDAGNTQPWMDTDDDDDGVLDDDDLFPTDPDETSDYDGDGIGDNADTDDDNDGYSDDVDPMPYDTDNDGLNNDVDTDDDADGIIDTEDIYPLDTDNDGQHNGIDSDDDGDGVLDIHEDLNMNGVVDSGEMDWLNPDTDGDGVDDGDDYDPLDPGVTEEPPPKGFGIWLPVLIVVIVMVVVFVVVYIYIIKKH